MSFYCRMNRKYYCLCKATELMYISVKPYMPALIFLNFFDRSYYA